MNNNDNNNKKDNNNNNKKAGADLSQVQLKLEMELCFV